MQNSVESHENAQQNCAEKRWSEKVMLWQLDEANPTVHNRDINACCQSVNNRLLAVDF